ncbi:carbamoyltransferase C-terminal domain-containing protein, partial [Desulfomarina sp.]
MNILAIHDGHTATACLLTNGKITSAISEERLGRIKGQGEFPVAAVKLILENEALNPSDIDIIALVGYLKPLTTINEYQTGRQKFFPEFIKYYPGDPRKIINFIVNQGKNRRLLDKTLTEQFHSLNLPVRQVKLVEHHQAHGATAYYLSHFYQNSHKTLVFTLDGSGDGLSGTVSIVDESGNWTRLKNISSFDSLGIVYSRVTQYLAMKPWEHEFKLMGMAPYCATEYSERVFDILHQCIRLSDDNLSFINQKKLWGNSLLSYLKIVLADHRFDAVAAGVQLLHERLLVPFVDSWINKTGVHNIAVAGGCFMNIKANKLLMELDSVEDIFVMPSCGDDSCALGAALWEYGRQKETATRAKISPLDNLYWGPNFASEEIKQTLLRYQEKIEYKKSDDIEKESASLLADHKIIGRMSGRMEWGSRALGNRSIIANASRLQNIRKLNAAIKMRDFWMPFAPSILWERRHDYAKIDKDIPAYHMVMGFDSTELAREHLIAALHPYDFTMRPQFVKKEHNPQYHRLLSEFEKLTGFGGVLNTSFNLHGWPIVCSPEDAVSTFLKSDLD